MKKFKIKEILKGNEVKKNLEVTFEENSMRITYLDENYTEEISYNEITKIKYVGNYLQVGVFVGNIIFGYFKSEFKSNKHYKNFTDNLNTIIKRKYKNTLEERLGQLKHPIGEGYIFLKEAIMIYLVLYDSNITIQKIYTILAEKYNTKIENVEQNIRYAINKIYQNNEKQEQLLAHKETGKITNQKFISKFAEEVISECINNRYGCI